MPCRWPSAVVVVIVLVAGCGHQPDMSVALRRAPAGLVVTESRFDFDTTVRRLDAALPGAHSTAHVAHFDHAEQATAVGLSLRPTEHTLVNTTRGAALVQQEPLAGLDLPPRVLLYETPDGRAMLVYHTTEYLAQRYGIVEDEALPTLVGALRRLAEQAADSTAMPGDTVSIAPGAGIIQITSRFSVNRTFERLRAAVEVHDTLSVVGTIDHAANARRAGLAMPPARLLVIDDPRRTTRLTQDAPTAALDLPPRMLVYQAADDSVHLAYNNPFFLAERHVINNQQQHLQALNTALARLAAQATSAE